MKKSVTLWQMLCWTYGRQMAHRYLRVPADWIEWMFAVTYESEGDVARPNVALDAAMLHAAVTELGESDALLVVVSALDGIQPCPVVTAPRPYRMDSILVERMLPDDRWEGGGSQPRHIVRRDCDVVVLEPVYQRTGRRGRPRLVGHEPRKVAVEFCPLAWDPDPSWVAAAADIHRRWLAAMNVLLAEVKKMTFADFDVGSHGCDMQPSIEIEPQVIADVIAAARGANTRSQVVNFQEEKDAMVVHFGEDSYSLLRRHARVTTK